ncbi:hypothetical protein F183_A49520 [Bryobacterales bacterium F-183]|nr:hypothetical protein F183_A49520 [Bryobacterales bacterium F-183]
MTDFRTSVAGRVRVVTASIRFTNKLKRDLTLGLVANSGVTIDDQGNRYVINGTDGVRGIGLIDSRVDAKFTLRPGEPADARVEMVWQPGREIIGLNFEMEFAVRELIPTPSGQWRLGLEHPLRFTGLRAGAAVAAPAAAPPAVTAAPPVQAPASGPDPCTGLPRCYNAGLFTAEIQNIASSMYGERHHIIKFNVRIRNLTDQQLILGSTYNTLSATDELGNRYAASPTAVTGMGQVTRVKADPQFVLAPGQTRNAAFEVMRRNSGRPNGTVYTLDASLEQLEVLPSQQVRSVKQFSLSFTNLSIPPLGAAGAVQQPTQKLIDLFKKKK